MSYAIHPDEDEYDGPCGRKNRTHQVGHETDNAWLHLHSLLYHSIKTMQGRTLGVRRRVDARNLQEIIATSSSETGGLDSYRAVETGWKRNSSSRSMNPRFE